MLMQRLLEESENTPDLSWLIWVVLVVFVLLVFLGWWASKRLPKEEESVENHDHSDAHAEPSHDNEHVEVKTSGAAGAVVVNHEEGVLSMDDLTRLEGIGPKVQSVLNGIGINTFGDLINADPTVIRKALDDANFKFMDSSSWAEQARFAADGDWDGLKSLQGKLKGGRG